MNILCKMFGHKAPIYAHSGWYSPGEKYATIRRTERYNRIISYGYLDSIGRIHGEVHGECPRCGVIWKICLVHVPTGLDKFGEKEFE